MAETAAVQLADTFGRYIAARTDWKRQDELWSDMLNLYDVHVAERKASALMRLKGTA